MRNAILGSFLAAQTLIAFALGGCGATFDFAELRQMEAPGEGFPAALSREYKAFALFEADEMNDWPDAAHFGTKARNAAAGTAVPPEKPQDWRLPADKVGEIAAGWARLTDALDRDAAARLPGIAAHAQVNFDCWVEQQEENWQTDHIARCRDGFLAAIGAIEVDFAATGKLGSLTPATPAVASALPVPAPKGFTVFFDFDSADLLPEGSTVVKAVAAAAEAGHTVRFVIGGHADRAGPAGYNEALSLRRAAAVREVLIGAGVDAGRIAVSAFGETRPRVATPDGMREPRNRRVEITVGPATES